MSDPVLVDTDPGIYDALTHHFLVATGGWDLKAVAGILPLPRAVANARGLAALLGIERDVPVQALSEKSPGPGGRLVHEDSQGISLPAGCALNSTVGRSLRGRL